MSIPVTCPECQSHFHVGDEFAGRPGRCPECATILHVPDPAAGHDHDAHDLHEHPDPEPHPVWAAAAADAFEGLPAPAVEARPPARPEPAVDLRAYSVGDRPRFDPHQRADRWARVHRGLGYVQVAVILGFLSQMLQTVLMLARGGVQQNPNGLPDSGQVAMGCGAVVMVLAAWMFWVLGRAAGLRVPYVPARPSARASFVMVVCSIGACLLTFCFLFAALGAQPNGGAEAAVLMLLAVGTMFGTGALLTGAEVAGLVSLGRIGDALGDRAAAGWARRSIVVLFLAVGLVLTGLCGLSVYIAMHAPPPNAQAGVGPGPAGNKAPEKDKGAKAPPNPGKGANPAPPPANGANQNPPPPELAETVTLIANLVVYIPLLVYLIHYSVALQAGRRAIRREMDVLLGRDHGEHDRHY